MKIKLILFLLLGYTVHSQSQNDSLNTFISDSVLFKSISKNVLDVYTIESQYYILYINCRDQNIKLTDALNAFYRRRRIIKHKSTKK